MRAAQTQSVVEVTAGGSFDSVRAQLAQTAVQTVPRPTFAHEECGARINTSKSAERFGCSRYPRAGLECLVFLCLSWKPPRS
jgi:hypothetical protein